MTEELPRERKARRRLEKEGATVHMAEAPGTIHAAEQRARASLGVHVAPGYEHAKEAEQRAFPPGWHAALTSALGASLAERAKARQANAEGAADAGKAKPKAKAKAAKGGAKGGDEAADRNEIQQLEGKIQAIGHHFAAKHFSHFARQPALLEPPAIDRAVRARVVSKSAVEMLTALQMTDEAAAAAGKAAGDGSPAGSPVRAQSKASQRAKLTSKGSQRGDPPKSAGGAAAASAAAGGSSGSALQQLVERQIKFVGQRALWREACRRAAADDDDATASPADAPSASTLPGAESGGHGAASPPDMRLVLGLLGEGVAAGLEAVPSLKARLPALSGSELPPALREAAWRVAMGHGERDIEKCGDLLHGCPLARSAAGYPDAESDARLASAPWHLLAKGLDSLDLAPAAKKEVEGRACALLLQARECGSSDVPSPADFGALALAVALGTPSPPESLAARARRDAEARRQASLLGGKNEKLSGGHMNPIEHPLEPSPVAMLLHAARHGVVTAVAAAGAPESGVLPLVESRWPRLFTHLTNICSRADLADVIRRKQGPQPPRATLQKVLETEWLHNGFVGALPREALLWAWDQFALQGWGLAAELAAACLWLIRREVRRLDRDDNAGVTELRVAMCVALRQAAQLEQLQALLAPAAARVRERAGLSDVAPQVMLKMPVA